MADELRKVIGVAAAGKVISDLDEVKKQATIQANEAKKQTALQERQFEEQRERESERIMREQERDEKERERNDQYEDEKKNEKYQEFIDKAEAINLTPFSAEVLYRFFNKKNIMSFNRAAERLKKIAELQKLEFITIDKDPNSKKIEHFHNEIYNDFFQDLKCTPQKYLNDRNKSRDLIIDLLIDCINDDELSFTNLLKDKKEKNLEEKKYREVENIKKESKTKEEIRKIIIKRMDYASPEIKALKVELDSLCVIDNQIEKAGKKKMLFLFFIFTFASVGLFIDGNIVLGIFSSLFFGGGGTFWFYKAMTIQRTIKEKQKLYKEKISVPKKQLTEDAIQKQVNDFYSRKLQDMLSNEEKCEELGIDPSIGTKINSYNTKNLHDIEDLTKIWVDELRQCEGVIGKEERFEQLTMLISMALKKGHQLVKELNQETEKIQQNTRAGKRAA